MDFYIILQLLTNLCVITEFVRPLVGTLLPYKICCPIKSVQLSRSRSSETKSTISVTAPTVPWMIVRPPV